MIFAPDVFFAMVRIQRRCPVRPYREQVERLCLMLFQESEFISGSLFVDILDFNEKKQKNFFLFLISPTKESSPSDIGREVAVFIDNIERSFYRAYLYNAAQSAL